MLAVLPPAFDPTPTAVEEIARSLPASARASIEWFPNALRSAFIGPLSRAPVSRFRETLDQITVDAVRAFLRLIARLGTLPTTTIAEMFGQLDEARERARHDEIAHRIEQVSPVAADDLREAYEWLRAVLMATRISLREQRFPESAFSNVFDTLTDDQIRQDLAGEAGVFFRGLLLTVGALDLVLEPAALPACIVEWCRLALEEMYTAANLLRVAGMPVQTEVQIPGFSAIEWRRRRARIPLSGAKLLDFQPRGEQCPPGVIEQLVELMHPEEIWLFGSRARGTARPESDWDLLVVLPDSTNVSLDLSSTWGELRDLRRQSIELVLMRRADFDENRHLLGTLAQIVASEGRVVYGR